ncbi:Lrp/AsnC family transcriptional regulator [Salinisphaera sp. Q1T1-3]|uniref:Lrp/AsnC family transcriptional regulator n=1 Tax=Salinisphaera sp. Q1T1-3 TaxID=2321229 RepID=UPI000E760225|nr:Lrp/AsnC family transcriptional regulator [Salinisphaera sp. Q1T1-3]RJS91167.1 Lrp/AsnC family transcriptional regulator [Salinisphaera sp. Q1T1-3]
MTDSLDRADRRILEILQTEGRISNQTLAERVNLSPSPCLRRVRALEEAGYITGYRATVDAQRLGYGLNVVLHISMDQHTPERFDAFETRVAALPEVVECLLITGQEADYQLRIWVVDMEDYQRLLLHHITRIPGVSGVHTSFVLRRVLTARALPART